MKITKSILKDGHRLKTNKQAKQTSFTIHSTANLRSTAANERAWLDNPSNTRQAAWHYVIGETDIIQAVDDNMVAWHAGSASGNNTSIGVELIESGDRLKVLNNAINFLVYKLKEKGWGTDRLKQHKDWSGKNCPRILIDNNYIKTVNGTRLDWNWFIKQINNKLKNKEDAGMKNWEKELGLKSLKNLSDKDLIEFETWKDRLSENVPMWLFLTLLDRSTDKI